MPLYSLSPSQAKRIIEICEEYDDVMVGESEGFEIQRRELLEGVYQLKHPVNEELIEKIGDVNWNTKTKLCGNWDTFQEIKKILEVQP